MYRSFFLLLFLCWLNVLLGQVSHFEHPTDKKQFLGGTILDLLQDRTGFIWIATTDGLGKYDGKTVVEYRNIRGDSTSLSNNYTSSLYEDRKGRIWITTKNGLNCYLPESDSFVQYFSQDKENIYARNYILDVLEDRRGFIWYTTYDGVFRLELDPQTALRRETLRFSADIENPYSLSSKLAYTIFEDQKGRLWFATPNGINYYENDETFQFNQIISDLNSNGLETNRIFNINEQVNGTIWVGTNKGFYKMTEKEEGFYFQSFTHEPDNANSLSHPFINNLTVEGDEKLWVATWGGGLNEVLLPQNETEEIQFIRHRQDPDDSRSLSIDQVNAVIKDRSGVIWVGTSSGLNKKLSASSKFLNIAPISNDDQSLSHKVIKSVLKDSKGNLWVGTYNGLNFLSAENLTQNKFEFQVFETDENDPSSISHNNIFGMEEDSEGRIWIGTYAGLNVVDGNTFFEKPHFKKLGLEEGLPSRWIYNIHEIESGKYWVPSYGGFSQVTYAPESPEQLEVQIYPMDPDQEDALGNSMTFEVQEDRFGEYWIATFLGLSKYVKKEGREYFENYKNIRGDTMSISDNSIITIFLDSKGRLWVGTRNGLNLVLQKSAEERAVFRCFGSREGFPNDVIQSIEEDEMGRLWIGTNKGLVLFDPDAAINKEPSVLKIYNKEDGLGARGFVYRASHKASDGTLFFGTAGGLAIFKHDEMQNNSYVPPIVFTNLKILNEVVQPSNQEKAILKKSIHLTDTLILTHQQNIISLDFAALDYSRPEKNQYQYQLEGFNADWVFNENSNSVTYTNLSPGDYLFKVKGSNNDGVWNEKPTELFIRILPPFWKTWWAYLLYFFAFSGLVYAFIRFRIRQKIKSLEEQTKIKAARYEEREILRKKNAADFHDELGNRLTKINLFLELAERESSDNAALTQFLKKIKTNTAGLSDGIRDLIWSLDPKKDTVYQTVLRLQEFGDRLFDFSTINFKTQSVDEQLNKWELEPDIRKQVLLLFKEAMNNCLKYSQAENALMETGFDGSGVFVCFKDDGIGFDPLEQEKGYGLGNMQERAKHIGGTLQIKSGQGEGTSIVLSLPLKK